MDLRTLLRGGVTGRDDPYLNEKSPFAKYPLPPKKAPLPQKRPSQKAAVAAAAAAPGALWRQNPPIPQQRPTGGPGGGTLTGQAPMGGPGGGTFTGQAPIGGPGGGTFTGQAPVYPTVAQDQGYGLPQPTPPHSVPTHYPSIMQDQGYGLPQPTPPHSAPPGGPTGMPAPVMPVQRGGPPMMPAEDPGGGYNGMGLASPGAVHAVVGHSRAEQPSQNLPAGGLMEFMRRLFGGQ